MQILDGSDIKHAEDSFDNIKPLCHELLQRKLELINDNNNQGQTFVNRSLFKSHPHYISEKCRFCTSYAANSKDILKHFELFYSHSDKFILVI